MKRLPLGAALAALALAAPAAAQPNPLLARAHEALMRLDVAEARQLLAPLPQERPDVLVERALLAIYEDDCDEALALLESHGLAARQPGAELAELARGCARVSAMTTVLRREQQGFILRFKNDDDAALAPLLMQVAEQALTTLERDLKTRLPRPVHIDVVSDHHSLAAMTGLPEEAAQTTGTVAIAKWGRVTMLSPRAMGAHGYAWADTLMHELTHLSVSRASDDRAPLWVQEGVAKREETRWRSPFPFDDQPPPDAVARLGFDRGLALPLDKLGPSIAMLPSAEQAMVAFAEVNGFLRFWIKENGDDALATFLRSLATSPVQDGVNITLRQQTGADLAAWSERWQKSLASVSTALPPDLMPLPPRPGEAPSAQASPRDIYRSARLADLLRDRGHLPQAAVQAKKSHEAAPNTAAGRARLALLLRALGRRDEAAALTSSLDQVRSAHGLFLALHGAVQRKQGDESAARQSFFQALCHDPLDAEVACELLDADAVPDGEAQATLCRQVRRR